MEKYTTFENLKNSTNLNLSSKTKEIKSEESFINFINLLRASVNKNSQSNILKKVTESKNGR
ncbi:MAG TPA: hypothetical protein VF465_21095 [Flavobacterium sp.]|uniref:hypothetical protein n=1 Tax=Flavobacterium sp. TaxID=239 RepID=UPI002ED3C127